MTTETFKTQSPLTFQHLAAVGPAATEQSMG